jgi:hypothetical protein
VEENGRKECLQNTPRSNLEKMINGFFPQERVGTRNDNRKMETVDKEMV